METLSAYFKLSERNSSVGQELRAGLTTFLAMAYIIAVNPAILSSAGIPVVACITATCLGAGLMTILMGLCSNRPVALASGLGVNAMIAAAAINMAGGDWHAAMGVVFLEGLIILFLVVFGLREAIMEAIPVSLRHAISVGLGLFVALIGLTNAGLISHNEATLVSLGKLYDPNVIVGIISIVATVFLSVKGINGSILFGIIIAVLVGIPLGVTHLPSEIVSPLDLSTFGAPFQKDAEGVMGIVKVLTNPTLIILALSLMMSDFFDTMGTALAVAKQGDFLTEDGKVEDIKSILVVDSLAAAFGGFIGVSSITTFLESVSGASEGGRSGLCAIFTGVLFILAAFFAPLFTIVSGAATCGALVYVGSLMMGEVAEIDWYHPLHSFPAFMVIAGIPFTFSISNGIGLGFIAYAIVAIAAGKANTIKPLMWISVIAFFVYFLFV